MLGSYRKHEPLMVVKMGVNVQNCNSQKNVKEPILIHNYGTQFFERIQQPPIKPASPYSIFNETNSSLRILKQ